MNKILIATNAQKILDFLVENPSKKFTSREIQRATKASKAGTNFALNDLVNAKFIKRDKRGKFYLYSINSTSPVVKQLKVLKTIIYLSPTIKKIKSSSKKIILYGSKSRGEDTEDSDIDLFVVTNSPERIKRIIKKSTTSKKIQLIIKTPLQYVEMETTNPTFNNEIERGIVLWESKDES
jgi:predicted nucleotidyltransferase